ncbi:MAG: hypothetical protein ACOYNR_13630 [Blastocatellia bacterium]
MSNPAMMTGAAAAHQAAIANAIKASGAIVQLEPEGFIAILQKSKDPLVVYAEGGVFSVNYQYLTSYKGLIFFTKSRTPLRLPGGAEIVNAKKIWIPG